MQEISVREFTYDKQAYLMTADASDLHGKLDLDPLLSYEPFRIIGEREAKRYQFNGAVRERSRFESGDILYWVFFPTDRSGRRADGPELHIMND